MSAPREAVDAAIEAMSRLNVVGPMRHIFHDDEMADALEVLLAQEVEVAAEGVVNAVVAALDIPALIAKAKADALREAAGRIDNSFAAPVIRDALLRRADRIEAQP